MRLLIARAQLLRARQKKAESGNPPSAIRKKPEPGFRHPNKQGDSNNVRRQCGECLWFAAVPVAGALGVTGFLLVARELGLLLVTGEWTAQSVGLVLTWLGLTAADGQSWLVNLFLVFPISWLLVLVAPALFSAIVAAAERLEKGSANK